MRTPAVRRLVLSYGFCAVGSSMVAVASAFIAFSESGSVVLTVLVLGANAAPALVLSPLVGRVATRRDPRTVEAVGQIAKIVLSVVLTVFAATGELTYVVLLVMNVLNGTVSALTAPAWPRLTRLSAPEGRLAEVTATLSGINSVASIIGAVTGGMIVALVGAPWVFGFNAVSYVPLFFAVRMVPGTPSVGRHTRRAVRTGIDIVRRSDTLRRAFVLAAVLNLAAWPVLSVLPAVAHDIDARAHALGLLTGAFFAGAAAVSFVVVRLRRRLTYGSILFWGFFSAGVLLCANAALTAWRAPGSDAVVVAALTLVPIGLAVALDSSLLQALVQLGTRREDQAPVLVVYATVTTIVTPIGGLAIGAIADQLSLWGALTVCGVLLIVLTLVLRKRLTVFDQLDQSPAGTGPASAGPAIRHPHRGLLHRFGEHNPGSLGHLLHTHDEPAPDEPAHDTPAGIGTG